jgi:hypothetical protein
MFFRSQADRAQDLVLYQEAEALFGKQVLLEMLDGMKAERAFRRDTRSQMLKFVAFFEDETRRYHSSRLQAALEGMLAVLIVLRHFTAAHFFIFPKEQQEENVKYHLHPDYFEFGICEGTMAEHDFYLNLDLLLKKHLQQLDKAQKTYYSLVSKTLKPDKG